MTTFCLRENKSFSRKHTRTSASPSYLCINCFKHNLSKYNLQIIMNHFILFSAFGGTELGASVLQLKVLIK